MEYSIWISPLAVGSGATGSPSVFTGVLSVYAIGAEGTECGSGVLIAEEIDGEGDEWSGNIISWHLWKPL